MVLSSHFLTPTDWHVTLLSSNLLCGNPLWLHSNVSCKYQRKENFETRYTLTPCSSLKIVRSRSLDRHAVKHNKTRFVQKLIILLLSKPKHYIPLHILSKCRGYLSLPRPRSLLSMIHRYPSIFELFSIPYPPTPLNATKVYPQLCVRLTPAAASLAKQDSDLKLVISNTLAEKLQKLLMLSSHHRILLSKLVHLAPDLSMPPNFRSRLCNDYPEKFRTVDTSYGRALELVSWDPELAKPLPCLQVPSRELIVDRPLKFNLLRLRKGLNLKRAHQEFLIKFRDLPDVCPYKTPASELAKESLESEKRACAVVREVLGMMIEKRTLIDHLTHFRKDFGLPNKLRGMIVRHPELFYVSLKGQRDSVFLVEGFDEKGVLVKKDETLAIKNQWMKLLMEGKRMRQEKKKARKYDSKYGNEHKNDNHDHEMETDFDDDYDDGFESLFQYEDLDFEDERSDLPSNWLNGDFWITNNVDIINDADGGRIEPW
ncbi:protein WHAT'S THIS FACTOR 1, chloroplastic [Benincasa hispida]|uniref:protein WHAT'S THIS FACTOR 1, chloroplastic n=1 Tax=Benincasa hispida TaxID=102211 RepID=UPI001900E85F|nr:protein WHAT'S THIS FACTOR 1, chloroplastic [Benincasa hispida]XP_038904305.1 protein WHAT'S THIS FACTOR 1, chloroplastic [Benincasa hispida]